MSSDFSRRGLLGAAAAASAIFIAGCEVEPAPPKANPGPTVEGETPAADQGQLLWVLKDTVNHIKAADESLDAAKLAPRVTGSAADYRKALYEIIKKDDSYKSALERPSENMMLSVSTNNESYPRFIMTVAKAEQAGDLPYLMIMQQDGPRSPYQCWGWAKQAANGPALPAAIVGAAPVAIDATDYVVRPFEAINLYVDALNKGLTGGLEQKVAPDAYMTSLREVVDKQRAMLNKDVEPNSIATIEEFYHRVGEGKEFAGIRTADKGALIFTSLRSTRKTVIKKGSVTYPESVYTRLAGKTTFSKEIIVEAGETIVLYIPSKQAGGKVQLVAGYKSLISVSGS